MKKLMLASLLLAPLVSFADMAADVTINDPYVRETLTNVHTTAGYAVLTNSGKTEAVLVGVSSPKVKKGELHTIKTTQGVAKMYQVKQIPIPANGTTNLEPGGFHLMLFEVSVPLQVPNQVPVTFTFSDGSSKIVDMDVRNLAAPWSTGHKH